MRVLMTADTIGGVWTHALALCAQRSRIGIEFVLATMGRPLSDDQWAQVERLGVQVYESGFALEWMQDPWGEVEQCTEWLQSVAREVGPDVLHANAYAPLLADWPCPTLLGAHSCVCTWWMSVHGEPAPDRYARYRNTVHRALEAAGGVVAPTAAFAASLRREYALTRPIRAIHNGAAEPAWSAHKTDDLLVLTVGRLWDKAKNLPVLIEGMRGLDAPLVAIGDTGANAPEVSPNVCLAGALPAERVHRAMDQATIYTSPALYEPFGLGVLEAAQRNCALVLSDIDTFRELWDGAAVFLPPDDSSAWRRTIADLAANPCAVGAYALAARERARRYTDESMADQYAVLYRSLVGSSSPISAHAAEVA